MKYESLNKMNIFESNLKSELNNTLKNSNTKQNKMSDNNIQYSSEKLEKFKAIIEEQLKLTNKELTRFLNDRKVQKEQLANTNVDFNQSSKHFQQQAKNKQLINRLQSKARELKSALERIKNKTYGVCNRTGKLIREERLMARPVARFDILRK